MTVIINGTAGVNVASNTGVIVLYGSTSGTLTLQANATAGTNTLTLPATTGVLLANNSTFAGTGPAFSAYANSSTSITGNTYQKITYDLEEFDTNNNFASSRFTPTVAGYYFINAQVFFNTNSSAERIAWIYKNGSQFKGGTDITSVTNFQSSVSALVYLNGTTDYVEIYGFSGNTITTGTGSINSYFQGFLARSA